MNECVQTSLGKRNRDEDDDCSSGTIEQKEEKLNLLFFSQERRDFFQTNGFVVIPQVLSNMECDRFREEIKQAIASMDKERKVIADDASTWTAGNLPTSIHGIFQGYNIGHIRPVWEVRQHHNVNRTFAELWGVQPDQLFSSFDAACVIPPYELRGSRYKPDDGTRWMHVDQGKKKTGFHCAQGLVTLEDMDSDDATLRVLQYGHLLHEKMVKHFKFPSGDWLRLKEEQIRWLQEQDHRVHEVAICAKKGDLVLWDSRLPHCNSKAQANRPFPRWRVVTYVCQMPAPADAALRAKIAADKQTKFLKRRVTPHWPLATTAGFPEWPHHGKNPLEFNSLDRWFADEADLNDIGLRFAGFSKW